MMNRRDVIALGLGGIASMAVLPARAQGERVLKVGCTPTGAPFTFLNLQNEQIEGVMVDIIKEIAERKNLKIEIVPLAWSALIPSLTAGQIDVISAAVSYTAEREKIVLFSKIVNGFGEACFVKEGNDAAYVTREDLKGLTVGAQAGTFYYDRLLASGLFKDVKAYDLIPDIVREVANGRIDAGFADQPVIAYNIGEDTYTSIRIVESYKPVDMAEQGIIVRKGEAELLAQVNEAIDEMFAADLFNKIRASWKI